MKPILLFKQATNKSLIHTTQAIKFESPESSQSGFPPTSTSCNQKPPGNPLTMTTRSPHFPRLAELHKQEVQSCRVQTKQLPNLTQSEHKRKTKHIPTETMDTSSHVLLLTTALNPMVCHSWSLLLRKAGNCVIHPLPSAQGKISYFSSSSSSSMSLAKYLQVDYLLVIGTTGLHRLSYRAMKKFVLL